MRKYGLTSTEAYLEVEHREAVKQRKTNLDIAK